MTLHIFHWWLLLYSKQSVSLLAKKLLKQHMEKIRLFLYYQHWQIKLEILLKRCSFVKEFSLFSWQNVPPKRRMSGCGNYNYLTISVDRNITTLIWILDFLEVVGKVRTMKTDLLCAKWNSGQWSGFCKAVFCWTTIVISVPIRLQYGVLRDSDQARNFLRMGDRMEQRQC